MLIARAFGLISFAANCSTADLYSPTREYSQRTPIFSNIPARKTYCPAIPPSGTIAAGSTTTLFATEAR